MSSSVTSRLIKSASAAAASIRLPYNNTAIKCSINRSNQLFNRINYNNRSITAGIYRTSIIRSFATNNNSNESPQQPESTTTAGTESKTPATDTKSTDTTSSTTIADLTKKLSESELKSKDYQDKYIRSLAEIENVRNRMRNQIEDAKKFAVSNFAKSLLEVADTLELAAKSVKTSAIQSGRDTNTDPLLKSLLEGIEMTEKVLLKTFESNGIKKSVPLGDKFDPNLHHGLFQVEDPNKEFNTIMQVMTPGYTLNDRVLRAAQVGTTKLPQPPAANNNNGNQTQSQS